MDYFRDIIKILIIIKELQPTNQSGIHRKTGITYSHILKQLHILKKYDLITITKRGREQIITLTRKGMNTTDNLLLAMENLR